ncbi:MAG: HAMP domain-containing histidine kinase [Planctomycetes bacterium]|nr:HAMP domain-containing histidine kinase [Planctomycetota bacterium]
MIPLPTLKLRTKIVIYFVALLLAWSAVLFVAVSEMVSWKLYRASKARGAQLARHVAVEGDPMAAYEDSLALGDLLARMVKENPEIRYVVVQGDDGGVLASTFANGGLPRDLRTLQAPAAAGEEAAVRLIRYRNEMIYDYACRHGLATVRLGYSLSSAQDLKSQTGSWLLWLGVIGILAVFVAAYQISRPIEALTESLRADPAAGAAGKRRPEGTLETRAIQDGIERLHGELHERNEQLESARKLAHLGELSAVIAHEVNNPLGVVVLNSGFLADRCQAGEIRDEAAREVALLKLASRRATLAVQGLLQFARYTRKGAKPAPLARSLEPMIRETIELLGERVRAAGCAVAVEVAKDLPAVLFDVEGLQQVLLNLLQNSLDACPARGHISVGVSSDGATLRLQVLDDGQGMNEEVLRRAKEPFFTTKSQEVGSGLGLAISQAIVGAYGGSLELTSRPGEGTTATVMIPLRKQHERT